MYKSFLLCGIYAIIFLKTSRCNIFVKFIHLPFLGRGVVDLPEKLRSTVLFIGLNTPLNYFYTLSEIILELEYFQLPLGERVELEGRLVRGGRVVREGRVVRGGVGGRGVRGGLGGRVVRAGLGGRGVRLGGVGGVLTLGLTGNLNGGLTVGLT